MDFLLSPCAARLRAAAVALLLIALFECRIGELGAQPPKKRGPYEAESGGVRDVRSTHFLLHTDLSGREAEERVERLETMLRLISTYWGRPMQGVIECYVVRDLDAFPQAGMSPAGVSAIRTCGGVTLMRTVSDGRRYLAKSVVYANDRPEVVQHEAVHAYCHHTFGQTGPVWYSEGMAEMGHYWSETDLAVRAPSRETRFLREHPPKSIQETLSPFQVSGDSWQNYASRWALCHFLAHNPNYSEQFLSLGRGLLGGRSVTFEQTYALVARELALEYFLFLEHICPGYRVDLCTIDWKKRPACLRSGRMVTATVAAGRGWQPAGLSVGAGMPYEYSATGTWQITGQRREFDADGEDSGRGRLVGAILKDYRLSPEFELGTEGVLRLAAGGDLLLRCRNAWGEMAGDSGRVTVTFRLQGRGPTPRRREGKNHADGDSIRE